MSAPCAAAAGGAHAQEEEDASWAPLQPFCLYGALGLSKGFSGGATRVRARYHKAVGSRRRGRARYRAACEGDQQALLQVRQAAAAFLVLKDDERRRVYDEHNFEQLARAEGLMEVSALEACPFETADNFFAGEDEGDRDYLLLNSDSVPSDSEDEEAEGAEGATEEACGDGEGNGEGEGVDKDEGEDDEEDDEEEEEEENEALLLEATAAVEEAKKAAEAAGSAEAAASAPGGADSVGAGSNALPRAPIAALASGAAPGNRPEADHWASVQSRLKRQRLLEERKQQQAQQAQTADAVGAQGAQDAQ